MTMIRDSLILFFVIAIEFIFGQDFELKNFKLKEKYAKSIKLVRTKHYSFFWTVDGRFLELDAKIRKDMCIEAQKFASLPYMNDAEDHHVLEAHMYEIVADDEHERHIAIRCPTLPEVYLYPDQNKLRVMFIKLLADDFEFNVESVKSVSAVPQDRQSEEQLRKSYLSTLKYKNRWNFCFVAHKYVQVKVIFDNYEVNKPSLYVFNYKYWEEEYVALECPTTPKMYLFLEDAYKTINIALIESTY